MIGQLALFVLGVAVLVAGADCLVRGASRLAISFGISPLVVGLTVVAFGTSAPETALSVGAALQGHSEIALGNVVGSNIFNVLVVLGLSALIAPLAVNAQIIRQEVPIMIGVSALLMLLVRDGSLGVIEGAILVTLLAAYTAFLIVQSRRSAAVEVAEPPVADGAWARWEARIPVQLALIAGGLALLVLGSRWLVGAATAIAQWAGVSDLIIGLTIVAAGTSVPEVATSVAAAIKGERDIAVGNVIGSSTFNILGCLGLAALVAPAALPVPPAILSFDGWVMLATAFACVPIFLTQRRIERWEGALFLFYYGAYAAFLMLASAAHDALPAYSIAMLAFVIPLTVITLMISLMRHWRSGRG